MSTYNVLGTQIGLPLTVESVKEAVEQFKKDQANELVGDSNYEKLQLYRDVLICIRGKAAHAAELAEAALKIDDL